jgi:hypothetical protein
MSKAVVIPRNSKKVIKQAAQPGKPLFADDDFVILCPSAADSEVAQAALYFLPANYKLRVLVETFQDIIPFSSDQTISSRISFGSKKELSEEPAFSPDAIMYSDESDEQHDMDTAKVLISKKTDALVEDSQNNVFTAAFDKPEAVASAMLRIARAIA